MTEHPLPRAPLSAVSWSELDQQAGRSLVAYRGPLADRPGTTMRYAFDGWQGDATESPGEPVSSGLAVFGIEDMDGRSAVDLVVRNGTDWDNNHGADYRLWTNLVPVDSHLHAQTGGMGRLGLQALEIGLSSAGITRGIISWQDNTALDALVGDDSRFSRLVWVDPARSDPLEVGERLADRHVGLKLHPAVDGYPADDVRLDPFMEVAAAADRPVAVHSGPGHADPRKIARLATRFPSIPFILYHTYLGPPWGRRRAVNLAGTHPNLILETSWCSRHTVERLIDAVGHDRVIFGSDASVDGAHHYTHRNVEGRDTYKEIMMWLVDHLGLDAARDVLGDTTRRLFGLEFPERR